jgi:hypothetical protein
MNNGFDAVRSLTVVYSDTTAGRDRFPKEKRATSLNEIGRFLSQNVGDPKPLY